MGFGPAEKSLRRPSEVTVGGTRRKLNYDPDGHHSTLRKADRKIETLTLTSCEIPILSACASSNIEPSETDRCKLYPWTKHTGNLHAAIQYE